MTHERERGAVTAEVVLWCMAACSVGVIAYKTISQVVARGAGKVSVGITQFEARGAAESHTSTVAADLELASDDEVETGVPGVRAPGGGSLEDGVYYPGAGSPSVQPASVMTFGNPIDRWRGFVEIGRAYTTWLPAMTKDVYTVELPASATGYEIIVESKEVVPRLEAASQQDGQWNFLTTDYSARARSRINPEGSALVSRGVATVTSSTPVQLSFSVRDYYEGLRDGRRYQVKIVPRNGFGPLGSVLDAILASRFSSPR